ncbi:PAS domain-containing protein [Ramlibacter algicola]|uniref:PAS domain S-box protein n=1 Tax=Ramlibacter algicola TaxID=2795217 RepID=A0A934Q098_9BURK|nr:PAS domain S-box protein [Ramlibacter algicola]MBK0393694.1 PAS domain S-box protein [Ramlibacter algicola]
MAIETTPLPPDFHALLLEQMLEAVIVSDTQGIVRAWNRGAEMLFGYAAAEMLGQPMHGIIPERLRAAHDAGFARAVASGELRAQGKVLTTRAVPKDGRRMYVDFSFGLLRDANGQVKGVFAVGRDVTERQLAQAQARA